jgi:hypothetical protein
MNRICMAPAYQPDDARITLPALHYLRGAEGLLLRQAVAALPDPSHPTVAQIAALRKRFPAPPLHAALTLAVLQPQAAGKFPQLPYVWATPEALEQATHTVVARHKALRFSRVQPAHIFDLCAGIGGDALALAEVAPVTAIDLSPIRTACLEFNAADLPAPPPFPLEVRTSDIRNLLANLSRNAWVHIDPARRSAGRRSPRYQDLIPGPDFLETLFTRCQGGVIKLSPAVDFDSLPPGHLELVSHRGAVVQALLWLGPFPDAPETRTATVLDDTLPGWSFRALPQALSLPNIPFLHNPPAGKIVCFYELDGAVTRAGLAAAFARENHLLPVTIDGGYLVGEPDTPLLHNPALTAFQVHAVVPFSTDRVAHALRQLPSTAPGPVEVKSRGQPPGVDTDRLQTTWSRIRPSGHTVLLFHLADDTLAVITSRHAP